MSELVTDAMVEASARAEWAHEWPIRPWEKVPDDLANHYRDCSRNALEVVAPLIAAKVLRDAAKELHLGVGISALRITGEHAEEIARLAILAIAERFERAES